MGASSGVIADSRTWRLLARRLLLGVVTQLSVRTHMVGLILVIVTPLLMFSAFLVLRSAEREQKLMANSVRERTQIAAAAVDHALSGLRARLFILAASNHLRAGDLEAFREQAAEDARQLGLPVVLSDVNGQELVDTSVPLDDPLPMMTDREAIRRVVTTGEPDVSGLMVGPKGQGFMVALSIPVLRNSRLVYVLSFNIAPAIAQIVSGLDLPSDWLVAISDRRGVTLGRSRDADRFVGQMGRLPIIERFHATETGWFPLVSRDGVPVYNAFTRVKLSDWVIAVGIPDVVLFAPVRHSTLILTLTGSVALALALALAVMIGRRIANPLTALVAYADVVGRGGCVDVQTSGIREVDAVARSLHQASSRLQQNAAERERAADELRQSEQNYRALAEDLVVANQERTELLHRTVTMQEAERTRIARELHDSIGQYLTALRLAMNAIEPHVTKSDAAHQRLAEMKGLTARLGEELSRMAWELRPMALDDLGLRRAIAQYLEEWGERAGIHVDLEIALGDHPLSPEVETALFRVLQEAVTNVVKHSGADQVDVILEAMDGEVRLIVEDNGRGFALDNDTTHALGIKRFGLLGVRERLALIKGSLEVESAPHSGTTVYVRVPI